MVLYFGWGLLLAELAACHAYWRVRLQEWQLGDTLWECNIKKDDWNHLETRHLQAYDICPWFLIYIFFESGLWSSTCSHVASFRALRQWITILQSVIMSYATWMHARDGWFVAVGLWNATRFGFNFGNSIIVRNFDMTFLIHLYEVSHSFGTILFPWKCSNSDALRPFTGPCCGSWVCHGLYASVVSWMSWNEAANDPMTCFGSRLVGLWFLRKDFGGQEIEIHRNSIMFHKVGIVMQRHANLWECFNFIMSDTSTDMIHIR